jgi:hypothetical protein
MNPYTMTRAADDDGVIWYTFTPKGKTDTLKLRPDDYQNGAAMKVYVISWIASL